MEIKQYLKQAEGIYKAEGILKTGEFFKQNKNEELNKIINLKDYEKEIYLSYKTNFIISKLGLKEFKDIIHTFTYFISDFKAEEKKQERINEIKLNFPIELDINNKDLDGLKVKGNFNIDKIGIMGGFDSWEELEGKLVYLEQHKRLMIIPKGKRTRGYIINKGFLKNDKN